MHLDQLVVAVDHLRVAQRTGMMVLDNRVEARLPAVAMEVMEVTQDSWQALVPRVKCRAVVGVVRSAAPFPATRMEGMGQMVVLYLPTHLVLDLLSL